MNKYKIVPVYRHKTYGDWIVDYKLEKTEEEGGMPWHEAEAVRKNLKGRLKRGDLTRQA